MSELVCLAEDVICSGCFLCESPKILSVPLSEFYNAFQIGNKNNNCIIAIKKIT